MILVSSMNQEQRSGYYLIGAVICLILGIASTYLLNQRILSKCDEVIISEAIPNNFANCDKKEESQENSFNKELNDITNIEVVWFDINEDSITREKPIHTLKAIVNILEKDSTAKVKVDGYTDQTGTKCQNYCLSASRAANVTDFLVQQGIPIERIESCGHGSDNPYNDRRVELKIIH